MSSDFIAGIMNFRRRWMQGCSVLQSKVPAQKVSCQRCCSGPLRVRFDMGTNVAQNNLLIVGSSTTPPGSPPPHTSTDSTDIVAASSTLSSRDVQVASGDGLLLGSDSIASSRTATMSPLTSASCGKLTKATDNATTKFGTTLKSAEHRRLILRPRKPSSSKAHPLTSETSSSASPVSLSVPAVTSSSMVSSPSSAPSISTSSASRSMSLTSAPAHVEPSNTSAESEQLLDREREELLRSVDESSHPCCDWKIDDVCIACIFAEYQRSCIEALSAREIKKTDIADIMAIIGVFAPSMPTSRMHEFFSAQQLKIILGPGAELPDIDVDDAKIQKAVRLYLNNKGDEAEVPMTGGNKKIRIMLETLLEYLPMKTDNTVSESTFTVKYVAPIIQAYVDSDRVTSDFPNTDSVTQKHQNLKADRPDIRGKAFGQEVLWGEVTGPTQAGNNAKNLWDTYKLARFGKASIIAGKESAPLVQVIDDHGTYMRLYLKVRGVMILEELGEFVIPTRKSLVPALVATLPTLELLKEHLKEASHEKVSELKRSWGHQDVKGAKKRL
ncbi:hypothetical protein EDD21DRAFT_371612, partial [Dissophora ornata]